MVIYSLTLVNIKTYPVLKSDKTLDRATVYYNIFKGERKKQYFLKTLNSELLFLSDLSEILLGLTLPIY